jgi:hypothetical protein
MKCFPKGQNLNSAEATRSQRVCEAVSDYMAPPTNRAVNYTQFEEAAL